MITEMQQKMGGWIVELVAPALIMMMTGSLTFFLVEIFYYGDFPMRVKWVLALFVFASVLVSRISIMEGYERSVAYGLVLGGATVFVLTRLSEVSLFLSFLLIAVIWWFNSKLTWDCTVIDNTKDSTDRGLLSRLRWDNQTDKTAVDQAADADKTLGTSTENPEKTDSWTQRLFAKKNIPNTPGVWVLILSLAAFPIFGFGQGLLNDDLRRQHAFLYFCVYLVGGLGLLVTTALVGLQRYLQRRNATMPNSVAISWVLCGSLMIGAILIVAWFLPRPSTEYSIAENPFKLETKSRLPTSPTPILNEGKEDGRNDPQNPSSNPTSNSGKSNSGKSNSGKS
ncbi:MAG: hypothetical protein VX438_13750, partial [Planctomycetota bacterium]|nr:hypothetical protein [Planctomycetota bacterium]